ncbi:hypothetical protein CT0861_05000 [Colletotrichum tofieldiae]|uniref:Uncharacterized protein n=1 Tax=Colletotrichum tofieldiae TaxID=708197 RepID=A0A166T2Y6_9PEZI|nr:hypothetical protein CT0861_05000 [Colletotrichum tofieldiae]
MDGQDVGDLRVEIFSFGLALVGDFFLRCSFASLSGGPVCFHCPVIEKGAPKLCPKFPIVGGTDICRRRGPQGPKACFGGALGEGTWEKTTAWQFHPTWYRVSVSP